MDMLPSTWLSADYHLQRRILAAFLLLAASPAPWRPSTGTSHGAPGTDPYGIELFGIEYVKEVLFPHICAMPLHTHRQNGCISPQVLRAYKVEDKTHEIREAPVSREMATRKATFHLSLSSHVLAGTFSAGPGDDWLLGKASSLAWCTAVQNRRP